jgi:hypothetical protein
MAVLAVHCGTATKATSPATGLDGSGGDAEGEGLDGGQTDAFVTGDGGEPSVDCTSSATPQSTANVVIRRRLHGTNGDFEDQCDSNGMLTKYSCELMGPCQPQAPCTQVPTGKVIAQTIDCGGTCVSGECNPRCPTLGENLVYEGISADGSATLRSGTTGRTYTCQLSSMVVDGGFDCRTAPHVGTSVVVTDSGDAGPYCVAPSVHLTVGSTVVDPHCAYDCQVL